MSNLDQRFELLLAKSLVSEVILSRMKREEGEGKARTFVFLCPSRCQYLLDGAVESESEMNFLKGNDHHSTFVLDFAKGGSFFLLGLVDATKMGDKSTFA